MAWCQPGNQPLSEPIIISLLTHRYVSRPQWVNSLGPSEAIWCWRSWSTLVQVMACCLSAPSHYLNQCWLIISKVLWHSSEDIIIQDLKIPISKTRLKHTFSKSHYDLPGANELMYYSMCVSIAMDAWPIMGIWALVYCNVLATSYVALMPISLVILLIIQMWWKHHFAAVKILII